MPSPPPGQPGLGRGMLPQGRWLHQTKPVKPGPAWVLRWRRSCPDSWPLSWSSQAPPGCHPGPSMSHLPSQGRAQSTMGPASWDLSASQGEEKPSISPFRLLGSLNPITSLRTLLPEAGEAGSEGLTVPNPHLHAFVLFLLGKDQSSCGQSFQTPCPVAPPLERSPGRCWAGEGVPPPHTRP